MSQLPEGKYATPVQVGHSDLGEPDPKPEGNRPAPPSDLKLATNNNNIQNTASSEIGQIVYQGNSGGDYWVPQMIGDHELQFYMEI